MEKLVDLHCDTIWKLMDAGEEMTLGKNSFCVNIDEMKQADTMAQFFACFVDVGSFPEKERYENGYAYVKKMMERMRKEVENFSQEIVFARNRKEQKSGKDFCSSYRGRRRCIKRKNRTGRGTLEYGDTPDNNFVEL